MKICILTQPLNFNYGGVLQAYALQRVLREAGYDVSTDRFGARLKLPMSERIMRFGFHTWKRYICGYKLFNPFRFLFCGLNRHDEYAQICVNIERFISQQIKCVDFFEGRCAPTSQELNKYDLLVVGSDQVWRAVYSYLPAYFLSFTQNINIKRIAYAASFGVDNIDDYNGSIRSKCGEWLKKFDGISVREESGLEICHKEFGAKAELVLDPTMLLNMEDYLDLIKSHNTYHNTPPKDQTLMNYILNEDTMRNEITNQIASKLSLTPLNIIPHGVFDRRTKDLKDCTMPSIEEWLAGFRDAKFVVTDSFHGAVFSIIFNTPFVVIDNRGRGSARFTSLLKIFDLESRLISSADQINDSIFEPINWQKVNDTRLKWRQKSLHFLSSNLR
ncbi:MAG: polysaccharide pyruvyl transferase family protein [Rikenellaceae bacterium]